MVGLSLLPDVVDSKTVGFEDKRRTLEKRISFVNGFGWRYFGPILRLSAGIRQAKIFLPCGVVTLKLRYASFSP